VKVFCALPKESLGSAWFDDLFLGEGIIEEQAGNMLYNSSFETDKVRPGTPDCWVKDLWYCLGSSAWQPLIGEEGANWCMDSEVAYHGKRSLRIQGNGVAGRYVRGCMVAPDHIYTYSAYMKSDGGSVRARLYFNKPGGDPLQPPLHKDIIVDNAWKRYHFSRKIPLGVEKVCVGFSLSDNGILWIDAVQLERGEDATPYIPVEK
jgi:hypothetical protein